ncbi:early transcribed membrane protein (ETRAMP) [Plasmodium ovale curtisi]|uniref:Early transcribed membrane protein (ETRAMP) n=1 Tax=Plasmodium ovale curtisi TaxID=864141 RepID=A0A1A8WWK6_PLAOA|nr:early transcribed membrane protein (ETRAMP) [Plasmodium ovale curtisi]
MRIINVFAFFFIPLAINLLEPCACLNISSRYIKNKLRTVQENIKRKNKNKKLIIGSVALGLTILAASALGIGFYMHKKEKKRIQELPSKHTLKEDEEIEGFGTKFVGDIIAEAKKKVADIFSNRNMEHQKLNRAVFASTNNEMEKAVNVTTAADEEMEKAVNVTTAADEEMEKAVNVTTAADEEMRKKAVHATTAADEEMRKKAVHATTAADEEMEKAVHATTAADEEMKRSVHATADKKINKSASSPPAEKGDNGTVLSPVEKKKNVTNSPTCKPRRRGAISVNAENFPFTRSDVSKNNENVFSIKNFFNVYKEIRKMLE